jgi:hypothetical protein
MVLALLGAVALPAYGQTASSRAPAGAASPTASSPAAAPARTATAPSSSSSSPGAVPSAASPSGASPSGAAPAGAGVSAAQSALASNQFSSEQAAKAHCPADTIVWVNLGSSKAYHTSSDRYYGKTKHGAYMCQKEAEQTGFHAPGARASKTATKTTNTKPAAPK